MPRLEPVMTATVPVRSNGGFLIVVPPLAVSYLAVIPARNEVGSPASMLLMVVMDSGLIASRCPGMTEGELDQSPCVGDGAEVIVGVAKAVLDHGQPLEVVTDLGLHGHADAAMELDRLLADELQRFADLHFRGRKRRGALFG